MKTKAEFDPAVAAKRSAALAARIAGLRRPLLLAGQRAGADGAPLLLSSRFAVHTKSQEHRRGSTRLGHDRRAQGGRIRTATMPTRYGPTPPGKT
jgi:hypothetical protein